MSARTIIPKAFHGPSATPRTRGWRVFAERAELVRQKQFAEQFAQQSGENNQSLAEKERIWNDLKRLIRPTSGRAPLKAGIDSIALEYHGLNVRPINCSVFIH